jgi:hypothetical protein
MPVTASLQPDRIGAALGGTTALTLRLRNEAADNQIVTLKPSGELAAHTVLETETIHLDAGETFDVPVIIDIGTTLTAGPHPANIDVSTVAGDSVQAVAFIEIDAAVEYSVDLRPVHTSSSRVGRHRIVVENTGNIAVSLDLVATPETAATIDIGTARAIVDPGARALIDVKVSPPERTWRGSATDHPFEVVVAEPGGVPHRFEGVYTQQPRLGAWVLPAVLGALGALLIGTIAWFALLRPAVEDIADQAIADDRAALLERIAALDAAAAEAQELPLGEPTDLRLAVEVAAGTEGSDSFTIGSDRVVSVTDIVLQNPTGASGMISISRNGEVLLESEMANFRDADYHFVAPYVFEGGDTLALEVSCTTPGPSASECTAAASVVGFVDDPT